VPTDSRRTGPSGRRAASRRARPVLALIAGLVLAVAGPTGPAGLAAQETAEQGLPSPGTAFALSFGTTAAPVVAGALVGDKVGLGLVGAGLLFGPLSGYAYGDVMDRGGRGLGFRAAVTGATAGGILIMCQLGDCNPFNDNPEDQDLAAGAVIVGLVGTAIVGGSALIDVLSVPDHVSDANEAKRADGEIEARLSVAPYVARDGGVGLAARLRF
jgi:hypothetical protein